MKRYDRAYFDRWYRDPQHRVVARGEVARKVAMAVGVAEFLLGRRLRTVLDVGCGEGAWGLEIKRLRPGATYVGVDPSPYVVRRFGRRRNIRRGSFTTLAEHARAVGSARVDLIVCSDVLHYLPAAEVARGLAQVRALLGGVAYLDAFTTADAVEGDLDGWYHRPPAFYRRQFARACLAPCGPNCYAPPALALQAAALELPPAGTTS